MADNRTELRQGAIPFVSVSPGLERPTLRSAFRCHPAHLGTSLEFRMNDPENSYSLMDHDVVGAEAARATLSQNRGEVVGPVFGAKTQNSKFWNL